ncbi:MAG: leucine-rich repeat protein [Bacteroidales bacterium]|nr:leucine-rich repeat protein [Bacteroidales bacterium]
MRNKLKHFVRLSVLIAMLTGFSNKLLAYDFKVDGIAYNIISPTSVEVTYEKGSNYSGSVTVTIPSSVTCNGTTYSVTNIGNFAFAFNSNLTMVTIPGSITNIDFDAFCYCSNSLTRIDVESSNTRYSSIDGVLYSKNKDTIVTYPCGLSGAFNIPNSVTSIGHRAFYRCTGLTSIDIPNSVTSIGIGAFSYCTGLTSVETPNSVTSIGIGAFSYCTGLTNINVSSDNINYSSIDGVLYNKKQDTIIQYPAGKIGAFTIPNTVVDISNYTFYGCIDLTELNIPNGVKCIGHHAFDGCKNVKIIDIPSSVDSIGVGIFWYCNNLRTVICRKSSPPKFLYYTDYDFYSIHDLLFYNYDTISTLYVPCDSLDLYKTQGWRYPNFTKQIGYTTINDVDKEIWGGYYMNSNISGPQVIVTSEDKNCSDIAKINLHIIYDSLLFTDTVTNIHPTYATVHGRFAIYDTMPSSTQAFQYKLYNDTSEFTTVMAETNGNNFSQIITDLYPSTTYQYRSLMLLSDGDTVFGEIKTFNTDTVRVGFAIYKYTPTVFTCSIIYNDSLITKKLQYSLDTINWIDAPITDSTWLIYVDLKDLLPNTMYWLKLLAIPSWGDTLFATYYFTTPALKIYYTSASDINTYSAKITASYNDGDITKGIQYKSSSSSNWLNASIVNTNDTVIYADLKYLSPDIAYNYRAFAVTSAGDTIYSTIDNFTTKPLIQTLSVSDITLKSAKLTARFHSDDDFISKGIKCANKVVASGAEDSIVANASKLLPSKKYSYQAFAVLSNGDTVFSETKTFTTQDFVKSVDAKTTQTTATITATFVTDNDIVSKGISFEGNGIVATTTADSLTTTVNGLKPFYLFYHYYYYRVFAVMSWGDTVSSSYSCMTHSITLGTSYANNINSTIATLNGDIAYGDVPDDSITIGFIFKDPYAEETDTIIVPSVNGYFSYNLSGLKADTKYYYKPFYKAYGKFDSYSSYKEFTTLPLEKQGNIYLIQNEEDLHKFASLVNNQREDYSSANYKLTRNITLDKSSTNNITPIGSYPSVAFTGTFDGNNKIIYNVNIEKLQDSCQGLFAYTRNAEIFNLGIANINVTSRKFTGGMIAVAENSKITNCYVKSGNLRATSYSGGLIGYQSDGDNSIIQGCYNNCSVEGNNYIGGLLGYSYQGVVRNSYVAAPVVGHGEYGIGAIIGGSYDVLMYDVYFSTNTTGQTKALGEVISKKAGPISTKAGEGRTDEEMKTDKFVTMLNNGMAVPVWVKDFTVQINDGFPILNWQNGTNATVSTYAATDITSNSATLHGKIVIEGDGVVAQGFFYKAVTDNDYTSVEINGEDISYNLTDLQPETTYLFKAYASSASDTIFGEEMTFTTLKGSGIEEIDNGNSLQIYPNPAKDVITLNIGHLTLDKDANVTIINNSGQVIYKSKIQSPKFNINISDFESGAYYINVGKFTKKLIVE